MELDLFKITFLAILQGFTEFLPISSSDHIPTGVIGFLFEDAVETYSRTSRSGITMTAGLFCGLDRRAAAKFSFLLAIPIITSGGLFKGLEMVETGTSTDWAVLRIVMGFALLGIYFSGVL